MDSCEQSSLRSSSFVRALRIALGTAFLAALFMVLSSTGASAAPNSTTVPSVSTGKALGPISDLLNPITNLGDKTISQVPVVNDIVGNGTVGKVTAPITGAVNRVESAVTNVPVVGNVVGAVVAPVGNLGNQVIAPITDVLGSVTTPVLGAVGQITSPVTPGTPGTPSTPGTSTTPDAPGAMLPGTMLPGTTAPDITDAQTQTPGMANSSAAAATTRGVPSSMFVAVNALHAGLAATGNPVLAGAATASGSTVAASCGDDGGGSTTGPCAPAITTSGAASAASGSSAGGSGGAGGSAAASECFPLSLDSSVSGAAMRAANWALPASITTDPGSSPG